MTSLPGWSVPILGGSLPDGYSIREDQDLAFLCFGAEDVVFVFTKNASLAQIEFALREDQQKKLGRRVVIP